MVSLGSISDAFSDAEQTEWLHCVKCTRHFFHTRLYPLVTIKVQSFFLPQVLWYGPMLYRYLVQALYGALLHWLLVILPDAISLIPSSPECIFGRVSHIKFTCTTGVYFKELHRCHHFIKVFVASMYVLLDKGT